MKIFNAFKKNRGFVPGKLYINNNGLVVKFIEIIDEGSRFPILSIKAKVVLPISNYTWYIGEIGKFGLKNWKLYE